MHCSLRDFCSWPPLTPVAFEEARRAAALHHEIGKLTKPRKTGPRALELRGRQCQCVHVSCGLPPRFPESHSPFRISDSPTDSQPRRGGPSACALRTRRPACGAGGGQRRAARGSGHRPSAPSLGTADNARGAALVDEERRSVLLGQGAEFHQRGHLPVHGEHPVKSMELIPCAVRLQCRARRRHHHQLRLRGHHYPCHHIWVSASARFHTFREVDIGPFPKDLTRGDSRSNKQTITLIRTGQSLATL